MSHLWKKVQDEMADKKILTKKSKNINLVGKIPDIFYKILKFLGPSWASIIAHKDLLDLIIWV